MLTFNEYARPGSPAEAWSMLQDGATAIQAGGLYLRLSNARLEKLISLDGCGMEEIQATNGRVLIGAMVTKRRIETDAVLAAASGGLLAKAVRHIMGVQVRNMATIGGSVWGRYGFSDLLTALLALNASVSLHKGGEIPLDTFLDAKRPDRDLLEAVTIPSTPVRSAWRDQRLTATDFSALNVAVVKGKDGWRIAVGARPARATLCHKAMALLDNAKDPAAIASEASTVTAQELKFGSDLHGSAEYRKDIAPVLVERAIKEALT